jgi:lipid-binding SYLF domain-containing protein
MKRILLAALPLLSLFASPAAHAQSKQQALVDRATISLQEMLTRPNGDGRQQFMREAKAVMICPQVFRAGFILAGAGGDCVLAGRAGGGSWSAPAFYVMGSGSVGFQIGIQDSEIVMMILTRRGLEAVMDSQFKFGADASIAVATIGAGVEGDTTAALRADIVAFSQTRGLFAGVALNGSILTSDTAWNRAYYGSDLAARQIVVQMQANNPGANPLRAMLSRFGSSNEPAPGYAPPQQGYNGPPPAGDAGPAPEQPYTPDARGSVSQQQLPPPGH